MADIDGASARQLSPLEMQFASKGKMKMTMFFAAIVTVVTMWTTAPATDENSAEPVARVRIMPVG